jgi:hypothetical protein
MLRIRRVAQGAQLVCAPCLVIHQRQEEPIARCGVCGNDCDMSLEMHQPSSLGSLIFSSARCSAGLVRNLGELLHKMR